MSDQAGARHAVRSNDYGNQIRTTVERTIWLLENGMCSTGKMLVASRYQYVLAYSYVRSFSNCTILYNYNTTLTIM